MKSSAGFAVAMPVELVLAPEVEEDLTEACDWYDGQDCRHDVAEGALAKEKPLLLYLAAHTDLFVDQTSRNSAGLRILTSPYALFGKCLLLPVTGALAFADK